MKIKSDNFTGSNREKSNIAVAILDKGQLNVISKSIVLHNSDSNPFFIYSYLWQFYHIYRVVQKSLWCDQEEKCLRNSKIFFGGVNLSICKITSFQEVRAI